MNIKKATVDDLNTIKSITYRTIEEIYPHYYARGAVDFFLKHHSEENIEKDLKEEIVYLLEDEGQKVGTVTIKGNEILRLFVLPECQKKGYGTGLLDFAEKKIAESYDEIIIDASIPAKRIYKRRGYQEIESHQIETDHGDFLCYDVMRKYANSPGRLSYDNKLFVSKENTANGEVDARTWFHYHQKGDLVWAEYTGGEIVKGFLIGTVDSVGELDFTYQHINVNHVVRMGKCHSIPDVLPNSKIVLREEWQWLNGDMSKGKSVIVEADEQEYIEK